MLTSVSSWQHHQTTQQPVIQIPKLRLVLILVLMYSVYCGHFESQHNTEHLNVISFEQISIC